MQFLIILAFFLLVITAFNYFKTLETWQDYIQKPYGYIFSGSDPLYFYRKDRYRRPYRDGFKFYQSYPIPHLTQYP